MHHVNARKFFQAAPTSKELGIARALAVKPKFIIADEAYFGTDVSIQAHSK